MMTKGYEAIARTTLRVIQEQISRINDVERTLTHHANLIQHVLARVKEQRKNKRARDSQD